MNDDAFWDRLAAMPYWEAETELRARRLWAMTQKREAAKAGEGGRMADLDLLITRINDELHLISQAQNRANIRRAMREVLPPEMYEAVIVHVAAMDPRAT
jgi:hypothetical protein